MILGNLIYSQLRTEEQLGYVVQGTVGSMSNAPRLDARGRGLRFAAILWDVQAMYLGFVCCVSRCGQEV